MTTRRWGIAAATAAVMITTLAGCSADSGTATDGAADDGIGITEFKLGYFPNFTHATAMVMLDQGFLQDELGDDVTITPVTFNSGTDAVQGLFANAMDVSFIGPNPTITGYTQSQGEALRVIAGAASGGAGLVVRDGIDTPEDLAGTTLATPSLGNTQDVALRFWLQEQGYETDTEGGGDVSVLPQDNATALQAFLQGDIDGAWEPEPWLTRMVAEGGGHVLVNEADTWEAGRFVVTDVIAATQFSEEHPAAVTAFLKAEIAATDWMAENPEEAQALVNAHIEDLTGSAMDESILQTAWDNVEFTVDPLADTLVESADHAVAVGLLEEPDLTGLYALDPLNELLAEAGEEEVSGP
jgi:NitT/TauT family transport system substrate-binding protein